MKHSRSSSEWEIRDAVVSRFRQLWPDARIIHEMNVEGGSSRADVVAVQPEHLWICEIKSERDKLSRLPDQLREFGPTCHGLIVAVHEKWTADRGMKEIEKGRYLARVPTLLEEASAGCSHFETWTFPEPASRHGRYWNEPYRYAVPWHFRMLRLLWADEIRAVAARHRVSFVPRAPAYKLIPQLCAVMTGREIELAVCAALRVRHFAEADEPKVAA